MSHNYLFKFFQIQTNNIRKSGLKLAWSILSTLGKIWLKINNVELSSNEQNCDKREVNCFEKIYI
jgi:hypothetical protein